jgi:hypothetical protein
MLLDGTLCMTPLKVSYFNSYWRDCIAPYYCVLGYGQ